MTTFINKAAAEQAAEKLNNQFKIAGYSETYIGQPYAKFMKVPRGGFYVANPWGKLV